MISFAPGFAISNLIKDLSYIEKLAVSFAFSFVILVMIVPFFMFDYEFIARFIFSSILIVSLWYLAKKRSKINLEINARFLVLVFILGLVSKFFIQILWEYPVMGGDWIAHTFQMPYAFEQGDWAPPKDRPAMFNLLIYSYHNLLGTSFYQYWVSQIIGVIINSIYIFPAYLIARKAFGEKIARVSVLFMLVTPFLIFNTLYTWPKNGAMYGILMMIYFLFFSEHDVKLRYTLAGLFGGLGFWLHNYTAIYIGIALSVLVLKAVKEHFFRDIGNDLKKLSYFLLIFIIVTAPHFAWLYSNYGTISTSKFIYFPFAVTGYESAFYDDKQELFDTFFSTPIKDIIMVRFSNAIITLTPAALPINPVAANFPTYNPIFYYSHDYPGALSTLMYLVVVVLFFKTLLGKTKINSIMTVFIIIPFLFFMIIFGWKDWGLLTGGLHPTIPLLIILGFNELYNSSNRINTKLFIYFLFTVSIIENVIFYQLIKKLYLIEGGLNNVSKSLQQTVPNADVSNFISAHFLFNSEMEILLNIIISVIISVFAYYVLMLKDISKS